VLFRFSATQRHGIPGIVTGLENGHYTVRTLNGVFTHILQGRLLRFELRAGDKIDCEHGSGVVVRLDDQRCRVKVGTAEFLLDRLAVLPCIEPRTGEDDNATVNLMRRTCKTALVHLDILTGEAREAATKRTKRGIDIRLDSSPRHQRSSDCPEVCASRRNLQRGSLWEVLLQPLGLELSPSA